MAQVNISPDFNYDHQYAHVLGSKMAYVDVGEPSDTTLVFLHGNPTSSYLWRNIIPHVSSLVHCVAPDLIGMGRSDKPTGIDYRFLDHAKYLSAFLDLVVPTGRIVLVLHDWGSALGLDWASRHEHRIAGLVLMEFVRPLATWDELAEEARGTFRAYRTPETGRHLIIEKNSFVEEFLPSCVVRPMSTKEMDHYRAPFLSVDSREPLYRWPNELPIAGSPHDTAAIVEKYHSWLLTTELPKLLFWATPGGLITKEKVVYYKKALKNLRDVDIGPGVHYLQEDNPHKIGDELRKWCVDVQNL